jgi:SAM-dependent methyltransferase
MESIERRLAQGQEREPPLELMLSRLRHAPTLRFIRSIKARTPLAGLDAGCGYLGQFISSVNRLPNVSFRGCDIAVDPAMPALFVLNLNAPAPLDAMFDIVTMHAVFEHLANPAAVLAFLSDHLKPGGFLILTMPTPLARHILELLAYRLKLISRREIDDHKHYWNRKRFAEFLEGAASPLTLLRHRYYQAGLNNWVLLQKPAGVADRRSAAVIR